jgi:hypothetical protein
MDKDAATLAGVDNGLVNGLENEENDNDDTYQSCLDSEDKLCKGKNKYHPLFLPAFKRTVNNQKKHILGCVHEVLDDTRKHYFESTDGVFHLYRGTNKNESCHRRLNHLYPDKCGENLFMAFITAFKFTWNIQRENGVNINTLDGIHPSCMNIANIDNMRILRELQNGDEQIGSLLRYSNLSFAITSSINTVPTRQYSDLNSHNNTESHRSSYRSSVRKKRKVSMENSNVVLLTESTSNMLRNCQEQMMEESVGISATNSVSKGNHAWTEEENDRLFQIIENTPMRSNGLRNWNQIAETWSMGSETLNVKQLQNQYSALKRKRTNNCIFPSSKCLVLCLSHGIQVIIQLVMMMAILMLTQCVVIEVHH